MIKAKTNKGVLIGLSDKNIKMLTSGQPIVFNGSDLGLGDQQVCIMHGTTEDSILAELQKEFDINKTTDKR